MNHEPVNSSTCLSSNSDLTCSLDRQVQEMQELLEILCQELQAAIPNATKSIETVSKRIALEVERVCQKSNRIQKSGQVQSWRLALGRHRLKKCIDYHKLGSRRGRVELHSHLSSIVYRYIAPTKAQLGFQARCTLIEDFLQGFYIEVLKAFRRENQLPTDYTPRTRLELAEYMAFTEHYAKRRINLPGCRNQQLIVLRAQGFANRQAPEAAVDIELALDSPRKDDSEEYSRSPAMKQIREQMITDTEDSTSAVLRDRVITELIEYLEEQNQPDCIDYLTLKLEDLSPPEIDAILGISPRQRDYLQQRFKYHAEKFSRSHRWQLVHQWLGADLDQNLGMPPYKWQEFVKQLTPEQQQLLSLKQTQAQNSTSPQLSDREIAKALKCTPKQVHKRWVQLLELAWQFRNQAHQ
ncbi:MAG: HetZ-related protein [Cyanothece sp. SIO1E1]|nr:HetZ-related protein [Cyanothece sp. SIO1E1]